MSLVRDAVLDEDTFLRLTLSGKLPGRDSPWTKAVVRPVMVRGRRRLQFSYFDGKKDTTRNFLGAKSVEKLDDLLSAPFSQFHVQSTSADLHVRITGKGKVLVGKGKPSRPERQALLAHDRVKRRPIPSGEPDAFLQALGLLSSSGQVRPSMSAKYHQINEFLRLMAQVIEGERPRAHPIEIVDCGCGSAYLTFAAHHYLNHLRGLPARVLGVDANEQIIADCLRLRDSLGWEGIEFRVSRIADLVPARPPDVVLSLHACDTATDEAIAQGVLWGSEVILAAPCCQHELHTQLGAPLFRPVLRHGILKERTADILTDAFRALLLRIMGYRADVVEFVSPEHTSKNLMIRARRALRPGDKGRLREYQDLKAFWGVRPCLEELLGETLAQFLTVPPTTNGEAP